MRLTSRAGPALVAAGWQRQQPALRCGALLAGTLAVGALSTLFPDQLPPVTALAVLPLLAGLVLASQREFGVVVAATMAVAAVVVTAMPVEYERFRVAQVALFFLISIWAFLVVRRREHLGLGAHRAASMLLDMRSQLLVHGRMPALPAEWHAEAELRPAHGGGFAGDFLVAQRSTHDAVDTLDLVLVDVSGHGADAGARALLLAGAIGAIAAAASDEDFLGQANRYVCGQDWDDGFATAVQLRIRLDTGDYVLGSAGHPPAARRDAGGGRWETTGATGPVLGVHEAAAYALHRGRLAPGDAALLYTDGVMEHPDRDFDVSVDRLVGLADDRLMRDGYAGGAARLIEIASERTDDDRSAVLLWREP